MVEIRLLTHIDKGDLQRVATGYIADSKYVVSYADDVDTVSFNLVLTSLATPYAGSPSTFDPETLDFYQRAVQTGWSFGAYADGTCIGVTVNDNYIYASTTITRAYSAVADSWLDRVGVCVVCCAS